MPDLPASPVLVVHDFGAVKEPPSLQQFMYPLALAPSISFVSPGGVGIGGAHSAAHRWLPAAPPTNKHTRWTPVEAFVALMLVLVALSHSPLDSTGHRDNNGTKKRATKRGNRNRSKKTCCRKGSSGSNGHLRLGLMLLTLSILVGSYAVRSL